MLCGRCRRACHEPEDGEGA